MKRTILSYLFLCCVGLASAQVNETRFIKNPSFEFGTSNWDIEGMTMQTNSDFSPKAGTVYLEKWVSQSSTVGDASVLQTLVNLPAGKYKLSASAQNYKQSSPTTKCTGAYLVAGDEKTIIQTPASYEVEFTNLTGQIQIGFVATKASGNWLAVDNFRLYRTEEISEQTLLDTLLSKCAAADTLLAWNIDEGLKAKISQSIANARALTASSEKSELQKALLSLVQLTERAHFAILLANATANPGTAPLVRRTNSYVPTGATQALMRFDCINCSGELERGVCWSTEHNPTILDERTTKHFVLNGNVYHIKGMKSSTVYYLRPYQMDKYYNVSYGDEVKIVTHPTGSCSGNWDYNAPNDAANARCSIAIDQTIEYFNEWTGIKGFTLSGHYGAETATADCSYGGWMRIGPNAGNQAIGTVIHETGHGVGVGTSARWGDDNFHAKSGDRRWKGREATTMLQFLENRAGDSNYYMKGDDQHSWGNVASFDWFVNGADKDKHDEFQYIGGCCLLYAFFVDGLCPTSSYSNGLAGYSYNFDDTAKYYLMCKDPERGLNTGLLTLSKQSVVYYNIRTENCLGEVSDKSAFHLEFDPNSGMYAFRSVEYDRYLTHSTDNSLSTKKATSEPTETEKFQLMPARTDVTIKVGDVSITTNGFWLTWVNSGNKAMSANSKSPNGICEVADYNASDNSTKQQWIILTEQQVQQLNQATLDLGLNNLESSAATKEIFNLSGQRVTAPTRGLYIINGNKTIIK